MKGLVLLLVVALWPLIGAGAIALVNRRYRRRGRRAPVPPARDGGEVMLYMYLWPVVLYKYLRGQGQ